MSPLSFAGTTKAANAPDIGEGIFEAEFIGVEAKVLEESRFDPEVYIWSFHLFDEDGDLIRHEGEALVVDRLTSRSLNVNSKTVQGAVKVLKALMTKAEFASFSEGGAIDASSLDRRRVKAVVTIRESGWPTIADVVKKT